MLLFIRVT